jgi:hypothetical protein
MKSDNATPQEIAEIEAKPDETFCPDMGPLNAAVAQ